MKNNIKLQVGYIVTVDKSFFSDAKKMHRNEDIKEIWHLDVLIATEILFQIRSFTKGDKETIPYDTLPITSDDIYANLMSECKKYTIKVNIDCLNFNSIGNSMQRLLLKYAPSMEDQMKAHQEINREISPKGKEGQSKNAAISCESFAYEILLFPNGRYHWVHKKTGLVFRKMTHMEGWEQVTQPHNQEDLKHLFKDKK